MTTPESLADIADEKLRRLAREQDAFAALDQGKLSLATYARLREGLATSRGEAAVALSALFHALPVDRTGRDDCPEIQAHDQAIALASDRPIPSATLTTWAAGWHAYASRTAAEAGDAPRDYCGRIITGNARRLCGDCASEWARTNGPQPTGCGAAL